MATDAESDTKYRSAVTTNPYEIKEGIVFCIELTPSILEFDPSLQHSQLEEILVALLDTTANLAISLPNTGIGCYVFNVAGQKDGIRKLFSLKDLNAKDTKLVNDILDDNQSGRKTLETEFPIAEQKSSLFKVFSTIQDDFMYTKTGKAAYNNKKILLFTDNDKPFNGDYSSQLTLKKLFSDFQESYIGIVPFFTDKPDGQRFNNSEYDSVLFQDIIDDANPDRPRVTAMRADSIKSKINRVKEIKRVQYTCPLEIAPGINISIKGYSMFAHEKLSSPMKVVNEGERYLMVNSSNILVDELTGAEVEPESCWKAYKCGNDIIPLTSDQLAAIKKFGLETKPFIKLIGFRGISHFMKNTNTGKSTFITADNNGTYEHSQRTLASLYQAMNKRNKFAVVYGCLRLNSSPALYSMIPCGENDSRFPEGFFLSRLPFRDDIRQLPQTAEAFPEPPTEFVQNYESILKRFYMRNGYVAQEYENPAMQWHFKIVRDEFCQVELPPGFLNSDNEIEQKVLNEFDTTKSKIGNVRNVIMASMVENEELVGGVPVETGKQQSVAEMIKLLNSRLNKLSNENAFVTKKPKAVDAELKDADILQAFKSDKLNSFKVGQLKNYIKKRHIPSMGATTKAHFIDAITDFLSDNDVKKESDV